MVQWDEAQPEEGEKVEGYRLKCTALHDGDQTLKTVDASKNTWADLGGSEGIYRVQHLRFGFQCPRKRTDELQDHATVR